MKISSEYKGKKIEINLEIPFRNENISNKYISGNLLELSFNGKQVQVNEICDSCIEIHRDIILFTAYNKGKDAHIEINITRDKENILNGINEFHKNLDDKFKDIYERVLKENGVLLISWNRVTNFTIMNTSPFNKYFIELETRMMEQKFKIFKKFKSISNEENIKIRIKDLIKIIEE